MVASNLGGHLHNYTPDREVAVDETMLKFHVCIVAQQYNFTKQTNSGA